MTAIPFIDLKAQQGAHRGRTASPGWMAWLAHCQFILGPEVAELETGTGRGFCGARQLAVGGKFRQPTPSRNRLHGVRASGGAMAVFLPAFTYTATGRGAAGAGCGARCSVDVDPAGHLPDRSGTPERRNRRGAAGGAAAGRRAADRRRSVRSAGRTGPALRRGRPNARALFTLDDLAQSYGCTLHGRPLGTGGPDATVTSLPSRRKPLGGLRPTAGLCSTESDERAALFIAACGPTARARHATRCCIPG